MSTNEKKFRSAAKSYAARESTPDKVLFAHRGKEILVRVTPHGEWTKTFQFNGENTVFVKHRLSSNSWDRYTVDEFVRAFA